MSEDSVRVRDCQFGFCVPVEVDGLKTEGIFTGRDHGQRNGVPITLSVEVLGFEPSAQPGIVDIRLVIPEAGVKPALNLKMIELQLDD
jgi:hypothetical protein